MLSERSEKNLEGVDERLANVVRKVAETYSILVIEGLRTKERQADLYAQGRTKPGKVITWTMKSKHLEGKAVDVVLLRNGKIHWEDPSDFVELGKVMLETATAMGVKLRWGYDWDRDSDIREKGENDGPHFELI